MSTYSLTLRINTKVLEQVFTLNLDLSIGSRTVGTKLIDTYYSDTRLKKLTSNTYYYYLADKYIFLCLSKKYLKAWVILYLNFF